MSNDLNKLSHTTWNCKYHIVLAPKYRRQVFYREKRVEIGKILRKLCEWKGGRDNRGGSMPGPYPYVVINTPEIQRRECNGVHKGEE